MHIAALGNMQYNADYNRRLYISYPQGYAHDVTHEEPHVSHWLCRDILELDYVGKVRAVGLSRPPAKLRINIRMSCAIYFIGYFLDIYPEQLFRYFKQILKQGRYYLHYMNNTNEFLHVVRYNHNMQYNARSIMHVV